jgi:hypothetical protein
MQNQRGSYPMMLYRSPIAINKIAEPDGLMRGTAALPQNGEIIHLGIVDPAGNIAFTTMAPDRPIDAATGQRVPFGPEELFQVDILFVMPGQSFPDTGYQYRASIQTPGGVVYLFQKTPGGTPRRGLVIVGKGGQG